MSDQTSDPMVLGLLERLSAETARADVAERKLESFQAALETAVLGWWEHLGTVRRQNADLQAANTALLLRARAAEVAQLEAEAALEEQDERD